VIVRVLGHGQFRLDDGDMGAVEAADDAVEAAIAASDEPAFQAALAGLIDTIESVGDAVPDEEFVTSDIIVPDRDITLAEAKALESGTEEGLIPG
jgi:hypothetical protein